MHQLSDNELILRYLDHSGAAAGDRLADELFRRYSGRVALWCLRMTGDREAAKDLAQDIFVKAFRNLPSFRHAAKFSTWLYTIARNHCANELRERIGRPKMESEDNLLDLADTVDGPLACLEREASARLLRRLTARTLDQTESQVITLHYGQEMPLDAITRLLDLRNRTGAKAYVVSARRKLRRALERCNMPA